MALFRLCLNHARRHTMKKMLLSALLISLVLTLCACGQQTETPSAPAPTPPSITSTLPGSGLTAAPSPEVEVKAEAAAVYDEEAFAAAQACVGKDVSALYNAIGEPADSVYAPSCLGKGDDGDLYYDGFTVETYREGEKETVREVFVNAG